MDCERNSQIKAIGTRLTSANSISQRRFSLTLITSMFRGLLPGRERVRRRAGSNGRVLDLAEAGDQIGPLSGLEDLDRLLAELLRVARGRVEADVDVVVVVGQRKRVAAEVEQGDDLVRLQRAL